jgi:hypothetical protein
MSNITAVVLVNPRLSLGSGATPCRPGVSGISPIYLPQSVSTTITRVARAMNMRCLSLSTVR